MPYEFEVAGTVCASPEEVFDTWMSSEGHSAMTGGLAVIDPREGGTFIAWNGYINGTTLQLERPMRIVQSWRTTQFTDDDEDSRIEVVLTALGGETLVTVHHSNVPNDHLGYEDGGWEKSYLTPMREYFAAGGPH